MPITSGDFTAAQLVTAQKKADKMWSDDMMKADFEGNVDTWKAIKAEQNANVKLLEDGEKNRDCKVYWANLCGETASDCDVVDDCDLEGNELGADSKTYNIDMCKEWKFTVDELKFRDSEMSFEEIVAKGFLKGDKIISEAVATAGLAKLESFKGTNVVTNGTGTWNAATTETDIAAADWNERLFAHLLRVGIQNQLSNPFLLSGSNMWEEWITAKANNANANGKGTGAMFKLIRTYFDLLNIDLANSPDLKSYMINRGSVAFASKHHYGAIPKRYKTQDRYSIPSRNLPGVRMDVFYTNRCVGKTIKHDFKMSLKFDYFLNPTGCDGTRTGVLAFNKV